MKRLFSCILFVFLIFSVTEAKATLLEISPEMELLAGVLSQTTWIDNMGPNGPGNQYFQALQSYFFTYRDHEAIKLAQNLTDKGFTFDAPPAFICHLGPLPDLELKYEYSDYVAKRGGGRDQLEAFRLALKDLANQADFLTFFNKWLPYLETSLEKSKEDFRGKLLINWLEDFYGWEATEFHLIMTPSMFPGGGYGATINESTGNPVVFSIIREDGQSRDYPEFPTGTDLENLTIHELSHSFVNPSLEIYPKRARSLGALMWPVREIMKNQAYPTITIFLNEHLVRAVEVISARDLFTLEVADRILTYHEERGFYLIRNLVEELEFYQVNRDLYPTFRDFVPYLYDRFDSYKDEHSTLWDKICGFFLR